MASRAGGIVFRWLDRGPEFLIVQARKHLDQWVFPKGRLESGESPEQAAVREVSEEAGVRTRLLGPAGCLEYICDHELVRVQFFLMEYRGEAERQERRERRWCTEAQATALLSHDGSRHLLRQAAEMLRRKPG